MGSSLAPILVERVVEHIVDKTLEELKLQPDFWFTYVDGHLTAMKRELIVQDKLNSFDPLVQFTVKIQKDGSKSIEFLDTTVFNCGGKVKTKWYHKPIASNRLFNFYSEHPKGNMDLNTATAFVERVFSLSHSSFHQENKVNIQRILKKIQFSGQSY